jgi:hypothetical protein
MARIRTIKPDFFTSEDIVSLSPHARLLYIALWCEADREGRLNWRPGTFKLRYFPADEEVNINELCISLLDQGLVVLYGAGYAHIPTFLEHQHINPRESASVLPAPPPVDKSRVEDASSRVTDAQVGREGRERKGREVRERTREAVDNSKAVDKSKAGDKYPLKGNGKSANEWALELGIQRVSGEHEGSFQARVLEAVEKHKAGQPA